MDEPDDVFGSEKPGSPPPVAETAVEAIEGRAVVEDIDVKLGKLNSGVVVVAVVEVVTVLLSEFMLGAGIPSEEATVEIDGNTGALLEVTVELRVVVNTEVT